MSEGDSVGDSVHGKPSVVYRFFTRLGQMMALHYQPNRMRNFVPSFEGFQSSNFGTPLRKGILVAMVYTFFKAFNVPVFWPILVMYFIMLFCTTMKRQIKHMIKYRYIPFTHGKRRYIGKEDVGKTFAS